MNNTKKLLPLFITIVLTTININCKNKIEDLFEKYHLNAPVPFEYKYKTEIYYQNKNKKGGFELPQKIEDKSLQNFGYLNRSVLFYTNFIRNPKFVRKYYLDKTIPKDHQGKIISCYTPDNFKLNYTYFDRGKNKLLVVGGGFTNEREIMIPFVEMFSGYNPKDPNDGYDIVLMEYRGHGYKDFKFSDPTTWFNWPSKIFFGANFGHVRLGAVEQIDVCAVVDHCKKLKNYKKIYGLGVCYSGLIFPKAVQKRQQETNGKENLFDKLILDGCWLSLENFIDKLMKDPKKICSPQRGGWGKKWPFKKLWFQKAMKFFAQRLFYVKFNEVSVLDFLPKLKNIPLLFFYGKDDLVISRQEFEIIWNATTVPEKTAIITSNPHVINHLKQKEFYKYACEIFLRNDSQEQFIESLRV